MPMWPRKLPADGIERGISVSKSGDEVRKALNNGNDNRNNR